MEKFGYKKFLSFGAIFLTTVVEEIWCGPVGYGGSQDYNFKNTLLKLFPLHNAEYPHNNIEGRYNYAPFYNEKFKPLYSHDYADESDDYEDGNDSKNRMEKQFGDFGSDQDSDNMRESKYSHFGFEAGSHPPFMYNGYGYTINHGPYGNQFGHFGYHQGPHFHHNFNHNHGFDHNHGFNHNHGFDHNHGCFPLGDNHGRRRPPQGPRGPPPPNGPPPSAPFPPPTTTSTSPPAITNAPTTAPTPAPTTSASIDPRQSTMAGIVRSKRPKIDIRFGVRESRGVRNEDAIVFPSK